MFINLKKILQSVHQFSQNVIVITEAEPFNALGPRIVFVNDAFVRETGYAREEAIGHETC